MTRKSLENVTELISEFNPKKKGFFDALSPNNEDDEPLISRLTDPQLFIMPETPHRFVDSTEADRIFVQLSNPVNRITQVKGDYLDVMMNTCAQNEIVKWLKLIKVL
jgi:hypothetical protein